MKVKSTSKVSACLAAVAMASVPLLGASPVAAMSTVKCTVKGTSGTDSIPVDVSTITASPYVVCLGLGDNDQVTLSASGAFDLSNKSILIVKGNGSMKVNWQLGASQSGYLTNKRIAVILPTNATINKGTSNNSDTTGSWAVCGTNLQYQAATSLDDLYTTTGSYLNFKNNNTILGC